VIGGNLKIQDSSTAYINANEFVFDSGYGWKQFLSVARLGGSVSTAEVVT
jgi:hypothetical protein